jgi:hypothetical protein
MTPFGSDISSTPPMRLFVFAGDAHGKMRNRLIHGYFDINLDVVWQTVKEDLPSLIKQINRILP